MSGHSKWSTIKRAKGANDAKRGALFTKLAREIVIAAKEGGADIESNFRLRLVIDKARSANMPKDNIERAIKRGAGQLDGEAEILEIIYEGYGPGGIAMLVEVATDNKNRAVSEVRHTFSRFGGNLGSDGCVAWMFSRKGQLVIDPGDSDPEEVALEAIDAGAEDFEIIEGGLEITTDLGDFKAVQEAMAAATYNIESAELVWLPQTYAELDEKDALRGLKLAEALEDLDDVQSVYSNVDISDELMAKYTGEAA